MRLTKNKKRIEAVAFVINSRGGSIVYSNILANAMKTFCTDNKLKLFTFTDSIAVSGGYYLLCVGDEVYASKPALVGSVGAIISNFDFKVLLDKYNLDRIYLTAKE
jgi:ClpP class serine protease